MKLLMITKKALAFVLAIQMVLLPTASTMAQAEMLSTDAAINKYSAYADRELLMSELQKDEIRDQIIALGVDPAEAEKRLSALSDDEIATILMQMDEGSAGADHGGHILDVMLVVFVILLITDLLCLTKIFPFVRCIA
ncbi:MAG: PA2779 family protein [Rhodobacteraceae bacterium]|nr:PA2779 family protein [Paracoccaceae bacterium]